MVRGFVEIVNARTYERAREFATPDFIFADTSGGRIDGVEAFIAAAPSYYASTGFPEIVVTEMSHQGNVTLARGFLRGGTGTIDAATFWLIQFKGGKVSRVDVTRAGEQPTLPSYAGRRS